MPGNVINANGVALPLGGNTTKGVVGTSAAEILTGTSANEVFRGNGGGDLLYGRQGDDLYNVYDARDRVIENAGEGVDTVLATVGYILPSEVENLQQFNATYGVGNALDNVISGQGTAGQWLDGASGNDVLSGGAGNDTFAIRQGGGHDVITDFVNGVDRARLAVGGLTSFLDVKAAMTQVGADVKLTLGSGGEELWFRNHQISDFGGQDFMLPIDSGRLNLKFGDEFDTLSLYSSVTKTGTWWTTFGSGFPLLNRTLKNNGEKQFYVEPGYTGSGSTDLGINPFSVNNGVVSITATKNDAAQRAALYGYEYSSGMLSTKTTFVQQYGYFEVSAKLPVGKGFWPGFWLSPNDNSYTPEIDIFEALGNQPNTTYQTLHPTGSKATTKLAYLDSPDQFHTYGLLWDRNYLVWYVDGVETNRMATPPEANKPMYLLLTLPVGGYWAGYPDPATFQSGSFQIDYVRVYALTNAAPIAQGETYAATEDTTLVIGKAAGLLANDTDTDAADAPWITSVLVAGPAHGAVVVNKDGSFTYTPTADYAGADSFTYAASDGLAQSKPVTVNLMVANVNDAPTAASGSGALNEDTSLTGALPGATDADGDVVTYAMTTAASHGAVTINADGSFTYSPDPDYNGPDGFGFSVSDGLGGVSTYGYNLTVASVNDAPVVAGETGRTVQGVAWTLPVLALLANDSDPDGDPLSVSSVGGATNGVVSLSGGVVTFTPNPGHVGAAGFTYEVSDGALTTTAAVTLTVVSAPPTYTSGGGGRDVLDMSARYTIQFVNGQGGDDVITGGQGADSLNGAAGDDVISGGVGSDVLTGGSGADTVSGGLGADRFVFTSSADFAAAGAIDVITDFSQADGDWIVLRDVDANTILAGDQSFAFIGGAAFTNLAGQLRYEVNGADGVLSGDTNGDGTADFQILLLGAPALSSANFLL